LHLIFKHILLLLNNNMSGQPYKYSKDVEGFRNEYMNTLGLRANIDNMNLQANKTYKETGALPPKSTMKDNRTTAEILADTEKLKLSIIGEFKSVCSPNMAMSVIQKVQASPLNADGSFLIWLAQNVTELVPQLKKKYKFGIEGNANDIDTMYLFLQTTFSKTRDLGSSVRTAFDRPAGSEAFGTAYGDFPKIREQYNDIAFRLSNTPTMTPLKIKVRQQFDEMDLLFAPKVYNGQQIPNLYKEVKDIHTGISMNINNYPQQTQNNLMLGFTDFIEYSEKLPAPSLLRTLLDQLQKSERNADPDLSVKILQNLNSVLPTQAETYRIHQVGMNIITLVGPIGAPVLPPGGAPPLAPAPPVFLPLPGGAPPPAGAPPMGGQVAADATSLLYYILTDIYGRWYQEDQQNGPIPAGTTENFADVGMRAGINQFLAGNPTIGPNIHYNENEMMTAIRQFTSNRGARNNDNMSYIDQLVQQHDNGNGAIDFVQGTENEFRHVIRNMGAYTMTGFGVGRRAGRPRGSGIVKPLHERIDNTKGIKQGHTHVPFGKYILNKNRLDDDIFYFKHNKGYGVHGYPARKITKNLSGIIKTIVGGGVPKFDELNNLSNEEKTYLHNVSKKAGIMDKISIPTPSKDMLERDIHQFEVMKGEILAGNDSHELIKKFKIILLKLSKNGTIPKQESMEIMEDLLALGY
jgi:hypothetical protein